MIARNSIGSPVAALRDGPYGSYQVQGSNASSPPYGKGSLGIQVADKSTSQSDPAEKVDFRGDRLLQLEQVGFHVFQTAENIDYGGTRNLPSIRFEIDPNVRADPTDSYSVAVWQPDPVPVGSPNRWSPYLDATTTGRWFLTGGETTCTQATPCRFTELKDSFAADDQPTIYSVSVSKGCDYLWAGAVDGLRINQYVYDFEANGVRARRAR